MKRIGVMAGITVAIIALLVIVVEQQRRAGAPSMEIGEALAAMGVTQGSGAAEEFELQTLAGENRTLADYEGKVVFLNFWATWCAPCVEEMPAMQTLADRFKDDGLRVVAVNVRERREQARDFVEELGLEYTVLLDANGEALNAYNVRGLPTTIIIDREGQVVGTRLGYHPWDDPETLEAFEALLQQV